jgi:hypothetical protein
MTAALLMPPRPADDWHLVLRLSLYSNRSKLQGFTYSFRHSKRTPTRPVFPPRFLDRPETEWEAVQSLALGVDLLTFYTKRRAE